MPAATLPVILANFRGIPTLTNEAIEVLCCLSLYLVALLSATWLHVRLRSRTPDDNVSRWRHWKASLAVSAVAAGFAGLLLFLPGTEHLIPNTWQGRGVFADPQAFTQQPEMARPASQRERDRAIGNLFHAIEKGVKDDAWPASRAEIDWVAPELWCVPGIPGYSYKYERTPEGASVEEPVAIESLWLGIETGESRTTPGRPGD